MAPVYSKGKQEAAETAPTKHTSKALKKPYSDEGPVKFFEVKGTKKKPAPHGLFSNFVLMEIVVDGVTYASTEHYYQCMKYIYEGAPAANTDFVAALRAIKTGSGVATVARMKTSAPWPYARNLIKEHRHFYDVAVLNPKWDEVKDDVMKKALKAKAKHQKFCDLLLSTGDREIIEDSPYDYYWGVGRRGDGKNMLGKLLMELRDELVAKSQSL